MKFSLDRGYVKGEWDDERTDLAIQVSSMSHATTEFPSMNEEQTTSRLLF